MGNFDEQDKRAPQPALIEDKRHSRNDELDDVPAIEAEEGPPFTGAQAEAVPSTDPAVSTPASPPAAAPRPAPAPSREDVATATAPFADDAGGEVLSGEDLSEAQQAEMAHLMQVLGLGLPGYLRSQLGILLNFALINLGRAPNPSTGLVTADLDQAKLAIDAFEFIFVKVQAQLDPRERLELSQLLSELKYTFMQALGGPPTVRAGAGDGEG